MEYHCFLCCCVYPTVNNFSLRIYRTSVFPLSLYRNESSIGERTLYKTLLLIRIFRKTVRQEQIQDTKSTRKRTSVFTTELNERVHESKQCIGLITVSDVILTGRQSGQKLQCLYGNPMAKNFFQNRILRNL